MSKRAGAILAVVLFCSSAYADFNGLVRAVDAHRGMHRVWTPGIGLARLVVWMVHPAGVHDFQLAVFEGKERFNHADFESIVATSGATPIIQVHSNRTGEVSVIWMQPIHRDTFELLLLAHDPNDETVVLRTVIDGETLAREISDPRYASEVARRSESGVK